MGKARIERTFPIGDALAIASSKSLRELRRKIPAGILLPLAELILGKRDFAPLRWSDQGLMVPKGNHTVCKQTVPAQFSKGKLSGSLANRGPRKPLKRLDLNFYIITVPTLCVTQPRRSARRSNRWVVCAHNLFTFERGRSRRVLSTRDVNESRQTGSAGTAPLYARVNHRIVDAQFFSLGGGRSF